MKVKSGKIKEERMATDSATSSKIPRTVPKRRISRRQSLRYQRLFGKTVALILLTFGALLVMLPLVWMLSTSLKARENATEFPPRWIPHENVKVFYDGRNRFMYEIPVNGEMRQLAMVKKQPEGMAIFVNPDDPSEEYLLKLDTGERMANVVIHWENYPNALTSQPFYKYTLNTIIIVGSTTVGILLSNTLVAYGFSRFRARWLDVLFLLLLSTIMLPPQVTLIPQFIFFNKLGWYDTYLPLIVPNFFANAWNVFLLRQFFMSVPLEMDEAARIDGASPLQVLLYVLVPQSWPALATIAIFHFLWTWNDFYWPLIYLQSQDKWTLALGLQSFNALYSQQIAHMMAAAFVTMLPCLIIFFVAQRLFIQGVVITGVKG
jgi:multiple sugar transport system permease protein